MKITERCGCGALFEVSGWLAGDIGPAIADFRNRHEKCRRTFRTRNSVESIPYIPESQFVKMPRPDDGR